MRDSPEELFKRNLGWCLESVNTARGNSPDQAGLASNISEPSSSVGTDSIQYNGFPGVDSTSEPPSQPLRLDFSFIKSCHELLTPPVIVMPP